MSVDFKQQNIGNRAILYMRWMLPRWALLQWLTLGLAVRRRHTLQRREHCTHVLIDRLHGTCVRVIEAAAEWVPEKIEASLVS